MKIDEGLFMGYQWDITRIFVLIGMIEPLFMGFNGYQWDIYGMI